MGRTQARKQRVRQNEILGTVRECTCPAREDHHCRHDGEMRIVRELCGTKEVALSGFVVLIVSRESAIPPAKLGHDRFVLRHSFCRSGTPSGAREEEEAPVTAVRKRVSISHVRAVVLQLGRERSTASGILSCSSTIERASYAFWAASNSLPGTGGYACYTYLMRVPR
ncbi:hypothetical protein DOTSEDRAFT_69365 [Dothistroma septosporum NZE10]|uniref:Uncharacterized protein n=1 Tax=Dothistroma septosporum (strain NZE10 / CBS 128990) TaxID=675120 RepID=N1PYT8_DOTSN|nr:hypothetical protein DOTSEDRAFT_69365 [Dothistroma septosporum NZE10]